LFFNVFSMNHPSFLQRYTAQSILMCTVLACPLAWPVAMAQSNAAEPSVSSDLLGQFLRERGKQSLPAAAADAAVAVAVADLASRVVVHAMGFVGVPYKMGGNSAETGLDCSGFVRAVFSQMTGQALPRRAEEQAASTSVIDRTELQPGDLVFFNTLRRSFSHVGIYIGDGRFVHSPRPGREVRVERMDKAYWVTRFDGARRALAQP
jgi:cell wall-associated NlpC family hydrolase